MSNANFFKDTYDILVPKNGTVEDLTNALIKKAQLDDEAKAGPIQIYEIHANKIHKELPHDYPVLTISEYTTIVAERIPEENLSEDENGFLIQVFHFQNEIGKSHGIPFKFRLLRVSISRGQLSYRKLTHSRAKNFLRPRSASKNGQVSRARTSRK
jgi:ubiquitin carboxyl-terminal hydrolase 7